MKKENVENYVKIQEVQFQEYTQLYGIDCDYFSRNLDYYDRDGNIRNLMKDGKYNPDIKDFTYFAGPERYSFGMMMPIKFVVDYGSDNYMFAAFGADTTNDAKLYVLKKQFTAKCLEFFGLPKNVDVKFSKTYEVVNNEIACDVSLNIPFQVEPDLQYNAIVKIDDLTKVNVGDEFGTEIIEGFEWPTISNIAVEHSQVINSNKFIKFDEDTFSAKVVYSKINSRGKGKIIVDFSFNISYNTFKTNYSAHWDTLDAITNEETGETLPVMFAPKVGDIVRIHLVNDPNEFRDYVITFVNDVNLSKDGISPLLTNFIWECNVTRRKPSHEDIVPVNSESGGVSVEQMEKGLETIVDKGQQEKVQDLNREKEVYDYDQQFDDVNGLIIDNIDAYKDGVFGSMNWVEEQDKDGN